jgi:hypothetical protein
MESAGHRCEVCGVSLSQLQGGTLSCHELWSYDDKRNTATLVGFEMHCSDCDLATHIGRAFQHGYGEAAIAQLSRVNGITREEAQQLFRRAMKLWRERSRKKWRAVVAHPLLIRYPVLAALIKRGRASPSRV